MYVLGIHIGEIEIFHKLWALVTTSHFVVSTEATDSSGFFVTRISLHHGDLPSGKRLHHYGKSLSFMGKLTISMAFSIAILT